MQYIIFSTNKTDNATTYNSNIPIHNISNSINQLSIYVNKKTKFFAIINTSSIADIWYLQPMTPSG